MSNVSEAETEPSDGDGGEMWTEWGVRRTWGDVGSVAFFERDYRSARKAAKEWPGQLVCRVVMAGDWLSGANEPEVDERLRTLTPGSIHLGCPNERPHEPHVVEVACWGPAPTYMFHCPGSN